ncbi:hypothetical protein ILUMI_09725 [Ignelater luminosus]|uniref:Uncharacterized protein n=1 Tax=Ignelater luminosus TaxID=2038154 RepID=A0A8K0D3N4_IGNLU|nr:hypothetical protein ILUMI_09725 [Ignelater luminosus]
MMSNEYRIFPVFVTVNVCAEYTKNSFGAKDILSKTNTNMKPCDMKKGFYYVYNLMPDFSKFPPHLPCGSYKIVTTVSYHSDRTYVLELYGKIKDKPVDWRKIPKKIWDRK